MPGLSGLDLQDRLIARGHCIPIIFMTGCLDDNVRARAMKAGAVCFLNKPFSLDHFIGCIEKVLKAACTKALSYPTVIGPSMSAPGPIALLSAEAAPAYISALPRKPT